MSWLEASRAFRQMLVEERVRAGLSQADLATRLGRPQAFISRLESGQRRLDVFEFVDVAKALGVDPVGWFARCVEVHLDAK